MAPGAVNWSAVGQQALAAAASSLGSSWTTVRTSAEHSVQMLVDTAEYIAENEDTLDADERNLLVKNQKAAMENVLIGYEAIGIVAAEQAVAAAWGVVSKALSTVIGAVL
jgi:hypothetical protein